MVGIRPYSLYPTHGPITVVAYEKIVAGRVPRGVPAFLVTLAPGLPLTNVFARLFAFVFETPLVRQHTWSGPARREYAPAEGVHR